MSAQAQEIATRDPSAIEAPRLPYGFARRHGVLLDSSEGRWRVWCRHDLSIALLIELRRFSGRPFTVHRITPEQFDQRLAELYEAGGAQSDQIVQDIGAHLDLEQMANSIGEPDDLMDNADDAPVIRLINALFAEAIKANASDIHVEPFEQRTAIRFRVDGVMREVLHPPRALAPLLVSRLKVMAHLDIAEKRLPQDGRIGLRLAGRPVDVRVSTLPSSAGERVVLRLLDKHAGRLDLRQLGMAPDTLEGLHALLAKPHGILLVTGPTGSGKTTTLYAALTRLNDRTRNIVTVEDPIEYELDGIGQTQVNPKVDYSFARGLRAMLRQDPDVVMVGEIRDLETAQIAVQASLTGHLVLSTLHTNTAVGAVTRLRDMGVESFLLASAVAGVLAQRLVRLLCPSCKQAYRASATECEALGLFCEQPPTLYRATGCPECGESGYRGRSGIYELVTIDEELRDQIHQGAAEQVLRRLARRTTPDIRHDGARRVLAGDTSVDEVLRVTQATE